MISEATLTLPIDAPKPKPKHSMLPLLSVLFLLSYGLMVLLVVEQNRTITSQRWLITELMSDSKELVGLKSKMLVQQRTEKQAVPKRESQTPSTQAAPESKSKSRRSASERPPKLASDAPDVRRAVNMI